MERYLSLTSFVETVRFRDVEIMSPLLMDDTTCEEEKGKGVRFKEEKEEMLMIAALAVAIMLLCYE